ncbi:hypothetical protein HCK01_38290, partial [Streptomyces sp. AA8]|nr:hypothetical protein [Streptomyces telluris]
LAHPLGGGAAAPGDDHTTGGSDDHTTGGSDDHTTGGSDDHSTLVPGLGAAGTSR